MTDHPTSSVGFRGPARRIALVVDRMSPGGKERVVMHLATEFAAGGFDPMVICLRDRGQLGRRLAEMGVPVEAIGSNRSYDLRAIVRLAGLLRGFHPDVVNVHDRSSLPYVVSATRLAGSCPVVLSCHGLLFGQKERPRLLERWALHRVAAVTAVSREVARDYAELLGISEPIEVISNGILIRSRDPGLGQEVRNELGLAEDVFLFVAVGNIKPEKGYDDLLVASEHLRHQVQGRRFVVAIAGSASDRACLRNLEDLTAKLGLRSTVKFLGYREDTLALYSAADAYVLPSRTEGLPMALLEAMSVGLPVVATAVGGVPEVLVQSGAGLLVEPRNPVSLAEGMRQLLTCPDARENVGLRGARFVRERHSAAAMARDYLNVYRRVTEPAEKRDRMSSRQRKRRIRVLMLGPLPPLVGGMATVMGNLRQSALARRCRVTTINNGKTTQDGRHVLTGIVAQIWVFARLIRNIVREKADIVHIHTCSGFTFWRDCFHAAVGELLGSRVIWHVHGGEFGDFGRQQDGFRKMLMRWAFEGASAVIVLSKEWLRRLAPLAQRARWRVVPNGVPLPDKRVAEQDPRPVFLFIGGFAEGKGGRDLIEAAAVARACGFDGQVEIAGGETMRGQKEELERYIVELGCDTRVCLVGVLSGESKREALCSAACLVLPSYAEGLPMAILEGMACGLPIIATSVGAVPEVITNGQEGFLIEPGDVPALAERMLRISSDPDLRKRMGQAARRRVEAEYSLDGMIGRIMDVYCEVLGWER